MKPGFNPRRRNRNIGTAKQGHGQNNRFVIPDLATASRSWKERLNPHQIVHRDVRGRGVAFIVEENSGGCIHPCTVDDIVRILTHIPWSDWTGLDTFVLRQSTRKQRIMAPAWGRLFYFADLGIAERNAVRTGPAVFLEAIDCGAGLAWSTSLQPDDAEELDRLRSDGHRIERVGNRHNISVTAESARATQLYRTLLHEIGHWVDWLEKVERPSGQGGDFGQLCDRYFERPKQEREAFAHRYADEMRLELEQRGIIPFSGLD